MGQQQQRGGSRKQQQQAAAAHNGSTAYPGVSTHGLAAAGLGEQAAAIDQETAQQNQYLDEISKGLDQLKFGAQVRLCLLCSTPSAAPRGGSCPDSCPLPLLVPPATAHK
jgi:hypothetical protein